MRTGMIVDGKLGLQEQRPPYFPQQHPAVRAVAQFISYVFHPLFVPLYVVWFLAYVHPLVFAGFDGFTKKTAVMGASFMAYTFFPLVTVGLLKALKFIDSIYLRTQKDRIIPFLACMTWYFYLWYVWNNFGKTRNPIDMPPEAVRFAFAAFISTVIGLMMNIKMKVSLHGISAGIVVCFFLMMAFTQDLHFGLWLSIVLFLAGLVCTARFIVSDHTPQEVYGGLLAGIVSMLIAYTVF